jgi:hypothetical protein
VPRAATMNAGGNSAGDRNRTGMALKRRSEQVEVNYFTLKKTFLRSLRDSSKRLP